MRQLDLEFLQYRYSSAMGWMLLGVGVLLVAASLWVGFALNADIRQLVSELPSGAQLLSDGRSAPAAPPTLTREQTAALAEMQKVSVQLSRPWERLFQTLEQLPREHVALLSLNCNAGTGQLRITAEARDFEAMLALHRQLEESPDLSNVSLLKHEIVSRQNERPVLFNLLAEWEVQDARF